MFSVHSTRFSFFMSISFFCSSCLSLSNGVSVTLCTIQPLDVVLAQNHRHIIALLEFVRYDYLPQIQQCSIKIMGILRYIQIYVPDYYLVKSTFFHVYACNQSN